MRIRIQILFDNATAIQEGCCINLMYFQVHHYHHDAFSVSKNSSSRRVPFQRWHSIGKAITNQLLLFYRQEMHLLKTENYKLLEPPSMYSNFCISIQHCSIAISIFASVENQGQNSNSILESGFGSFSRFFVIFVVIFPDIFIGFFSTF